MTRRLQAAAAPTHPLWMRWLAAACLVLVGVMSTAQAAHTHGAALAKTRISAHGPSVAGQASDEDTCPLCVAMHSALPAGPMPAPQAALVLTLTQGEASQPAPEQRWPFAMFSRPPPARA